MKGYFSSDGLITLLLEGVSLRSPGMTTGDRVSPFFSGRSCLSAGGERRLALPAC